MDSTEPPKKPEATSASLWPPILFVCAIFAMLFVADKIGASDPAIGRAFIGLVGGVVALGVFLWIVWGSTFRETIGNIGVAAKWIVTGVMISVALGGLLKCSTGPSDHSVDGVGDIPNQWRK